MIEVLVPIAIILLLVLANGLFVAAEFAIVGAPRASIEHQAAQGSRLARSRAARFSRIPSCRIATSRRRRSASRSRASGLGMYGEHWLADWTSLTGSRRSRPRAGSPRTRVASVIAIAILTYLHIVIGEMVPKALALQRAHKTVLYVSPVIRSARARLAAAGRRAERASATDCCGWSASSGSEVERERYHTAEELQFIVQESQEGGLLRGESGQHPARAVRVRRPDGG